MRKLFKDNKMKPNRRDFVKYSLGGILAASTAGAMAAKGSAKKAASGKKKNVLFIIVEDLKNIMGCYGNPLVQTPNIDRLARKGLRFDRAYCQYPVCNPSRSSFMTGLRVDTIGIYDNVMPWSTNLSGCITMPKLFKKNGYYTARLNKVFHGRNKHGMSIRTKRWRYIEWDNGKLVARELYDHASDPGEYRNLAEMPEFADVCTELNDILESGANKFE